MEQARLAVDKAALDAGGGNAEVGWADHSQQGRVEVVFAQTADIRSLILWDSLVMA